MWYILFLFSANCLQHQIRRIKKCRSSVTKVFLYGFNVFVSKILALISFFVQDHGTGALVISSLLDFLTFALCAPYSETTEGQQFDMLLEMVASDGRTLFKLFQVVDLCEQTVE